jgi:hypothetical protein
MYKHSPRGIGPYPSQALEGPLIFHAAAQAGEKQAVEGSLRLYQSESLPQQLGSVLRKLYFSVFL